MNRIIITEQDRDRRTKTSNVSIGEKEIITPNFCVRIKNQEELNAYIKFRIKNSIPHVSSCIFKYYDASNLIQPLLNEDLYNYLPDIKSIDTPIKNFLEKVPILIDPAMDSIYYSSEVNNFNKKGLKIDPTLRKYVLDYDRRNRSIAKRRISRSDVNKWRNKNYKKFWYKIRDDDNYRTKFIENMLNEQIKFRSDIPIAPTPLIISNEMLKIAFKVNDKSKELAKSINETCATSFYFKSNILGDEEALATVVNYIMKHDEETPLTVFKFKNLDLTHSKKIFERDNYQTLLLDLDDLSRMFPNKMFMVLENGNQIFASSLVGFHLVSSSFDGWDRTGGGGTGGPFGSWYDTFTMTFRSFKQDIEKMFKEHGKLLCDCSICRKYKKLPTNHKTWNIDRKLHHILKRNEDNSMILKGIENKDILHAVDKLGRSHISILRKTLPY